MVMIKFKKLTRDEIITLNEIRNLCIDYLHNSKKFSINDSYEWFDTEKPNYYSIYLNDKMIGYFRITNYSSFNHNLYIGADLHPEYWNKGFGFESYRKMIPYLFEEFNLNKITLEVLSNNLRAISLYKKLGFVVEGVKREEVLKNSEYVDSIVMSILKKELNNDY